MRHEVRTPERPEDKASEGTDGNSSNNSGPSDNEDAEYLAQGYTLLNTNLDSTSSDISDEDSAPEQVRRPSVTDTGVLERENSLDIEMAASHSISSTPAPTLDSELYRILENDKMYGRFPAQEHDIPDESSPALLWNSKVPSEISKILLTEEKVNQIKACFSDFHLPESNLPPWAKTFPEDVWKKELLVKLRDSSSHPAQRN